GLAGALLWGIAVQPFEGRHFLKKEPQVLAARPKRFGVQRVAGFAKGPVTNVRRLSRAGAFWRTLHCLLTAEFNLVRGETGMIARCGGRAHEKSAVEALALAEILGRDLMTDGTGDPVFRIGVLLRIFIEGNVREDLPQLALELGFVARHGHVA